MIKNFKNDKIKVLRIGILTISIVLICTKAVNASVYDVDPISRQFRKNNQPQFLWGIMSSVKNQEGFQLIKEMGFNVFNTWGRGTTGGPEDALSYASLADTNDIGLIVNLSNFIVGYESDILPNWLSGQELSEAEAAILYQGNRSTKRFCYAFHKENGKYPQSIKNLTFEQKSLLVKEYFNKNKTTLTTVINNALTSNNLVGFYLIDEPITEQARILGGYMADLVHTLAPNASVFSCYPPGSLNHISPPYILEQSWTAWADIIGTDDYVSPKSVNLVRKSVDYVTNNVGLVERRAKNENKVNWAVLATDANTASMISSGTKYTKKLQFLQTYIALMQGAKAIMYYQYPFRDLIETPTWFSDLSTHIKKLGPIAMQPEIEQNIIYDQPFELGAHYIGGKFPDVLVKLMRDPEGQYVLLAANTENNPVKINIKSSLFENGIIISRLFSQREYLISGNRLTDTLKGNETRAYTFTSTVDLDNPVIINVTRLILTETTNVASPTANMTPSYTFNSSISGNILYGGACTSDTNVAVIGENTIIFNALIDSEYNNCTITVIDNFGNKSTPLIVSTFTINSNIITDIYADVDGKNGINTTDALLTLRNSLGLTMSGTNWKASATTGDVNCDGSSNSIDAMLILRDVRGLSMSGTGWCAN